MDNFQRKLTHTEWNALEVPVSDHNRKILALVKDGVNNPNAVRHQAVTLAQFVKLTQTPAMESHLFVTIFKPETDQLLTRHKITVKFDTLTASGAKIKGGDAIRLEKASKTAAGNRDLFEFVLLDQARHALDQFKNKHRSWMVHTYNLNALNRIGARLDVNRFVMDVVRHVLEHLVPKLDWVVLLKQAPMCLEGNDLVGKYSDLALYPHQKGLIDAFKSAQGEPRLVLYAAPTNGGKTSTSPIALATQFRIIFVCASRTVALQMARSAISDGTPVAFAFDCKTGDDVRLHWSAVPATAVLSRDYKSGKIRKVDNSQGQNVRIMVSDIYSYLCAMRYMLAFGPADEIITFMDEPTIGLDVDSHPLHEIVKRNWANNKIPNVVLSSATLPLQEELGPMCDGFRARFGDTAKVVSIVSHDLRRSIPILDTDGYVVMPHHMSRDYSEIRKIVRRCMEYRTLLRHTDIEECVSFMTLVDSMGLQNCPQITNRFASLDEFTIEAVKAHYLQMICSVPESVWPDVYDRCMALRQPRLCVPSAASKTITKGTSVDSALLTPSPGAPLSRTITTPVSSAPPTAATADQPGKLFVTRDAHTITDGFALFLTADANKIARFCIQQAAIPRIVTDTIYQRIGRNNEINTQITAHENELEAMLTIREGGGGKWTKNHKSVTKVDKMDDDDETRPVNGTLVQLQEQLEQLRAQIQSVQMPSVYVPNSPEHLNRWCGSAAPPAGRPFTCSLDTETIVRIMALSGISDQDKLLLLLGIGMFTTATESVVEEANRRTDRGTTAYLEICKSLAESQRLFAVIAEPDYIYGTHTPACHGYIGADLTASLTQEKLVQLLGRTGRGHAHHRYSVRLRDNSVARLLFFPQPADQKPEVRNMNLLLCFPENGEPEDTTPPSTESTSVPVFGNCGDDGDESSGDEFE